jgi:septum formation protein
MTSPRLVLASTSRYRADLLRRLVDDFEQCAPGTDEHHVFEEKPAARALRLAVSKATAAGLHEHDALIIGSDQVAELDGQILDKPGDALTAQAQLTASSGQSLTFHTALCVLDTRNGNRQTHVDVTRVHFRQLSAEEIARYIDREQPLDCAGSFKCEGLGISLFERIDNSDPTALIGLPLIALARMLRQVGLTVP